MQVWSYHNYLNFQNVPKFVCKHMKNYAEAVTFMIYKP